MADEFQESEVIFSVDQEQQQGSYMEQHGEGQQPMLLCNNHANNDKKQTSNSSMPMRIPQFNTFSCRDAIDEFEEEMVPPHVIVGRRIAEKMVFSVCTGNGRTLKGRDLSQVRNSVLRLTGFLEA